MSQRIVTKMAPNSSMLQWLILNRREPSFTVVQHWKTLLFAYWFYEQHISKAYTKADTNQNLYKQVKR